MCDVAQVWKQPECDEEQCPRLALTFTKLSGKRPLLPLRSPSIQPSSSMYRTFLMMSPSRRVSSSSWSASYSNSTTTSAPDRVREERAKRGKREGERVTIGGEEGQRVEREMKWKKNKEFKEERDTGRA